MTRQDRSALITVADSTGEYQIDGAEDRQAQLALDFFETFAPEGRAVSSAPTALGYNRARVFVDAQGLALTARRALDVAYFIAAHSRVPSRYVSCTEKDGHMAHAVDLDFFKWLMGYASRNYVHLRAALRQGQKAAIQVFADEAQSACEQLAQGEVDAPKPRQRKSPSATEDWISVPLFGSVAISRGLVFFQIPKRLMPYIERPQVFDFLDLRYIFGTLRGKLLYDLVLPYVDEGMTPWFGLAELRERLDCKSKMFVENKYLNSRAIAPAIEDIAQNADLIVKTQEAPDEPGTRRAGRMRFLIKRDPQRGNDREQMGDLASYYEALTLEFGLNRAQVEETIRVRAQEGSAVVGQAVDYTRYQVRHARIKSSVAGYFMKALRERYVLGTAQLALDEAQRAGGHGSSSAAKARASAADVIAQTPKSDERYAQESAAGWRYLEALPQPEQADLLAEFLARPAARLAASGDQVELAEVTLERIEALPILAHNFGAFVFLQKSPRA